MEKSLMNRKFKWRAQNIKYNIRYVIECKRAKSIKDEFFGSANGYFALKLLLQNVTSNRSKNSSNVEKKLFTTVACSCDFEIVLLSTFMLEPVLLGLGLNSCLLS